MPHGRMPYGAYGEPKAKSVDAAPDDAHPGSPLMFRSNVQAAKQAGSTIIEMFFRL